MRRLDNWRELNHIGTETQRNARTSGVLSVPVYIDGSSLQLQTSEKICHRGHGVPHLCVLGDLCGTILPKGMKTFRRLENLLESGF